MREYFPKVKPIRYEGADSKTPMAFKHYDAKKKVLGKTMEDHFRFAVSYWHTFKGNGQDPFGLPTMIRSYNNSSDATVVAEQTMDAAFEFFTKLGVNYWCFHDVDISPEAETLAETEKRLDFIVSKAKSLQQATGIKLLWGTCNMFSHRRFLAGAATNPNPAVFAFAATKVKKALEVTKELGGQGYTFWGGREGYETLLNTDMGRELDHLGRFLHMAVDYAKKIKFKGQFYIEPQAQRTDQAPIRFRRGLVPRLSSEVRPRQEVQAEPGGEPRHPCRAYPAPRDRLCPRQWHSGFRRCQSR